MKRPRIDTMTFASGYPLYIQKAEKKGRTKAGVNQILFWLTGYDAQGLQKQIEGNGDWEAFLGHGPHFHPNALLISGVICGYRVEEIEDKTTWKIRCNG